jgi:hypothetical protein
MARRRKTRTPEEREASARQRHELEQLFERWFARLAAADAREAERRARLRRWTLGLLGREPLSPR